jgi:hypothetical protein
MKITWNKDIKTWEVWIDENNVRLFPTFKDALTYKKEFIAQIEKNELAHNDFNNGAQS